MAPKVLYLAVLEPIYISDLEVQFPGDKTTQRNFPKYTNQPDKIFTYLQSNLLQGGLTLPNREHYLSTNDTKIVDALKAIMFRHIMLLIKVIY